MIIMIRFQPVGYLVINYIKQCLLFSIRLTGTSLTNDPFNNIVFD